MGGGWTSTLSRSSEGLSRRRSNSAAIARWKSSRSCSTCLQRSADSWPPIVAVAASVHRRTSSGRSSGGPSNRRRDTRAGQAVRGTGHARCTGRSGAVCGRCGQHPGRGRTRATDGNRVPPRSARSRGSRPGRSRSASSGRPHRGPRQLVLERTRRVAVASRSAAVCTGRSSSSSDMTSTETGAVVPVPYAVLRKPAMSNSPSPGAVR